MCDLPDADLLKEFVRTESEEAFAALVHRHVDLVYSVAMRHTANPHDAQEITQAVFIILTRKARDLPPGTVLSGWLYHTARLTTANFQRSEGRRARREQEAYMQSSIEDAHPDASWQELSPLLEGNMGRLGSTDRDALVLRYFENKTLQEVGRALGVEERAAQKRVSRALDKLRNLFAKRGVTLSVAALAGAISANSVQAAPVGLAATITSTALKGSAVAASTVTLATETMKLMTWLKLKFLAGMASLMLVSGGALTVACLALADAQIPDIQGTWEGYAVLAGTGIIQGEANHSRLVLKFVKTNAAYRATVDAIDIGRKNIPIEIVYEYPSLRMKCDLIFVTNGKATSGATFQGTVNDAGTEILFSDGSNFTTFKRTTNPLVLPKRLAESEYTPRENSELQGLWRGTLGTGRGALPLIWKIAEDTNGTYRAELDNVMQGAYGQPVTVVFNPPAVDLIVRSGSGMFHGTLNSKKTVLTGSWIQGGGFTPSVFKLEIPQQEDPAIAAKDYTFTSTNDLQGHWQGTIQINDGKMRLLLDIGKLPNDTYAAQISTPDNAGNRDPVPASLFQYSPPTVIAEWKWIGSSFKGKLENGNLTGAVSIGLLGKASLPVTFERIGTK